MAVIPDHIKQHVDTTNYSLIASSFALAVPLSLGSVANFELNVALLLLPFCVWTLTRQIKSLVAALYLASITAGLVSCVIANFYDRDGLLWRHFLAVAVIMMPPVYYFLGRNTISHFALREIIRWIVIWSTCFVVVVVVRLLFLQQPFRIENEDGLQVLNAKLFFLPVFATFGVLSLAHLIILQATLCLAPILDRAYGKITRTIASVGLTAALFLIFKSDARSAQLVLPMPILAVFILAYFRPSHRRSLLLFGGCIVVATIGAYALIPSQGESRLFQTGKAITYPTVAEIRPEPPVAEPRQDPPRAEIQREPLEPSGAVEQPGVDLGKDFKGSTVAEALANGRFGLLQAASQDILTSPLIGQGFGRFARFTGIAQPKIVAISSATHVYFLTTLWKGGLLFAIPFYSMFALMLVIACRAIRSFDTTRIVALTAIVLMVLLSFSWDILSVASAGSLTFFILGSMNHEKQTS